MLLYYTIQEYDFTFFFHLFFYRFMLLIYKYTTFKSVCQVPAVFSSIQAIIS
ncbi:hypothetical protein HMPREF2534_00145 [Bacteroides thetaiotaomicron]|nr:hypothetical protein HMPREF2534_00145 [Bacteroides thetaiotaomicron]